jgi:hypothetical protein
MLGGKNYEFSQFKVNTPKEEERYGDLIINIEAGTGLLDSFQTAIHSSSFHLCIERFIERM